MEGEQKPTPNHSDSLPPPLPQVAKPESSPPQQPTPTQQLETIKKDMSAFERSTLKWARAACFVAAAAAIFACFQFIVMWKTLNEMKTSGDTAANQTWQAIGNMNWLARTMGGNLQLGKQALEEAKKQNDAALKTSIKSSHLDQRAWVAQTGLDIGRAEAGKWLTATVIFTNSGRTFAKQVRPNISISVTPTQFTTERSLLLASKSNPASGPGSFAVLAPGLLYPSTYKMFIPTTDLAVERATIDWYTYAWGRIEYLDVFGETHSTSFCQWRKGINDAFVQCPFHNDAD